MVGNGKAMFVNGTERKLISSEANYDVIVFLLQLRVRATLHLSRVYDGRRLSQPRSMKPGSPFQNEHPLRQKATECVRGYYRCNAAHSVPSVLGRKSYCQAKSWWSYEEPLQIDEQI